MADKLTGDRKLSAIMFSDICGYSQKMDADEDTAMALLEEHNAILKSIILSHDGTILKYIGDAIFSSYNSAADAVRCAVEIQKTLATRNQEKDDKNQVLVRIGIHIGDIIVKEGDLFGDGVNIASRIETLAEPGGILISQTVYDMVKARPEIQTVRIGSKKLKNIEEAVNIYRVLIGIENEQRSIAVRKKSKLLISIGIPLLAVLVVGLVYFLVQPSMHSSSVNNKTIAVLPFTNMSGNPEDEYFSDGMMEDILTQLSKIADLNVISRTSVMQYKGTKKTVGEIGKELNAGFVLEGSVRHAGDQVRIVAQLINATTDNHLWAETYDKELKQIFAVQSDVAQKIASALRAKLTRAEKERIEKKPTENLDAYVYYLQARDHANKSTKDMVIAIALDRKALQLDSTFALAYADLGRECAMAYQDVRRKSLIDSALTFAKKALSIDPNIAEGYNALGIAYEFIGDLDRALENYQKAMELNPNYFAPVHNLGNIYYTQGDLVKAMQLYKKSIVLNPIDADLHMSIASVYADLGEFERARSYADKVMEHGLLSSSPLQVFARISIEQGKPQEAMAYADTLITLYPDEIFNHSFAGGIHLFAGDLQKAKICFEKIVGKDSSAYSFWIPANNTTYLGYILLKLGERSKAQALFANSAKRSAQDLKDSPKDWTIPYDLAALEAIRGNKPEADKWMQEAIDKGLVNYRLAQLDPLFENLRTDEQFNQMMEQLKAKAAETRRKIDEMEKE